MFNPSSWLEKCHCFLRWFKHAGVPPRASHFFQEIHRLACKQVFCTHLPRKWTNVSPGKGTVSKGKLVLFQPSSISFERKFVRFFGFLRGSLKVFSFRIRLTSPVDVAKNLPGFSRFRDAEVVNNREPFSCSAVVEKGVALGTSKTLGMCCFWRLFSSYPPLKLPKTNIFAPQNGWLEDCFLFGANGLFSGANSLFVSGSVTHPSR